MAMTGLLIRHMDRHIRWILLSVSAVAAIFLIARGIGGLI
jgi:hypothetical protein